MWVITTALSLLCGYGSYQFQHSALLIWAIFFAVMTAAILIIEYVGEES